MLISVASPGFFFGTEGKVAPREVMRRAPFGKIAFANSDLSGIMDHRASIAESDRAVNQLLAWHSIAKSGLTTRARRQGT